MPPTSTIAIAHALDACSHSRSASITAASSACAGRGAAPALSII
jgi:hypothetical protein